MGLREDLLKRIERKQQEIQDLEGQIKEARSYKQALDDMLKMMPRDGVNSGSAGQFLRPGSGLAKAREAILKDGHPLHVTALLKALGRATDRSSRSGLSGSLAAYVRKGEIFTRPAPNTYGLIELGHTADGASAPPAGFGKDNDE